MSAFDTIKTLVGNYKLKSSNSTILESTNAHTLAEAARDHGDVVAHIIADLRTFTKTTDDWNDMTMDYAADVRKWVERTSTSNEDSHHHRGDRHHDVAINPIPQCTPKPSP